MALLGNKLSAINLEQSVIRGSSKYFLAAYITSQASSAFENSIFDEYIQLKEEEKDQINREYSGNCVLYKSASPHEVIV